MVESLFFLVAPPYQVYISKVFSVENAYQVTTLIGNKEIERFLYLSSKLVIDGSEVSKTYRLWKTRFKRGRMRFRKMIFGELSTDVWS